MNNHDEMRDSSVTFSPLSSEQPRFTIDEGFSEDSQQQNGTGQDEYDATAAHFQQWIQAQRPEIRADIAYEILRTLRTSQISTIVDQLMPLLHMDPIEKLPAEVTLMIFSYLDAATLLTASLASQTWRERILDPRLWQELYHAEGWRVDMREVRQFEAEHVNLVRSEFRKAKGQLRHSIGKGQPLFKRRATSDWLDSKQRQISADVAQWREQHGIVEADTDSLDNGDHEMQDVGASALESPSRPNKRQSNDSSDEMDYSQDAEVSAPHDVDYQAELLVEDGQGHVKLNWPHVYKQRRKLEENWLKGRFVNFQLPHPNHLYEAHTECVYTIQFFGKWLVSGSRDKTLRVWDLETRRLRGKPLTGHSQSVLCLQFDPTEEEDVIVSGSSDSSVIIWRFSTGQKLHVIPSAHEESVLNLKFDKRYLVTCSKDKKIKVWNRNAITPMDPEYPQVPDQARHSLNPVRVPSYIVDMTSMEPSRLEAKIANGQIKALQPYMHLMTLNGHGAAVNAIQINGDLIVSASGDRLIRLWNIKTGVCLRVLPGHQKGIACVQFDNKRIVSGSSDNTVRVYDLVSGTECAVLLGHQNLVRTVQAGFGDAPGSDEDNYIAAKQAERAFIENIETARMTNDRHAMRRMRNPEGSSSRSAMGARLPPGGGGSKWGRIVSGSYDESIIIWKKDAKGNWVIGQTLRQDAAVRASVERDAEQNTQEAPRTRRQRPAQAGHNLARSAGQIVQQAVNVSMSGLHNGIQNVVRLGRGSNSAPNQAQPNSAAGAGPSTALMAAVSSTVQSTTSQIINSAQMAASNAIHQAVTDGGQAQINFNYNASAPASSSYTVEVSASATPYNRTVITSPFTTQTSSNGAVNGSQVADQAHTSPNHAQSTAVHGSQASPASQTTVQPTQAAAPNQPPQTPTNAAANANTNATANNANGHGNAAANASVSRVFKLQFDARRIVCCSQDSRIIGWDFANGDPEIESASRFFVGP